MIEQEIAILTKILTVLDKCIDNGDENAIDALSKAYQRIKSVSNQAN